MLCNNIKSLKISVFFARLVGLKGECSYIFWLQKRVAYSMGEALIRVRVLIRGFNPCLYASKPIYFYRAIVSYLFSVIDFSVIYFQLSIFSYRKSGNLISQSQTSMREFHPIRYKHARMLCLDFSVIDFSGI